MNFREHLKMERLAVMRDRIAAAAPAQPRDPMAEIERLARRLEDRYGIGLEVEADIEFGVAPKGSH